MKVQGTVAATTGPSEDCFSQLVSGTATDTHNSFAENAGLFVENLSYQTVSSSVVAAAMEITSHSQQIGFHMENPNNHSNNLEEQVNNNYSGSSQDLSFHYNNWETSKLKRFYSTHQQNQQDQQFPYHTPTPDLLNLLHFPKSPASPYESSSLSFENPTHNAKTWLQPITHAYITPQPLSNDFVFGEGDDIEGSLAAYPDGSDGRDFGNGVLEFAQDVPDVGKKRGRRRTKQVTGTTERQRRADLSEKYDALKDLIPKPTKSDRASVVLDAIEYIKELLRTVNALKLLTEKKRHEEQRMKRVKIEGGMDGSKLDGIDDSDYHSYNESLRSSWIQRKSKDTEVDVRIVDDEVTIKLVQRKKINCLVYASRVLDELKLEVQHVASGHVGDFCSFFFNSKICEGSSVYASVIANKLIEVMDQSLAAA